MGAWAGLRVIARGLSHTPNCPIVGPALSGTVGPLAGSGCDHEVDRLACYAEPRKWDSATVRTYEKSPVAKSGAQSPHEPARRGLPSPDMKPMCSVLRRFRNPSL